MRTAPPRQAAHPNLRSAIERLDGLPLRPATARFVLGEAPEEPYETSSEVVATARWRSVTELDPAWALEESRGRSTACPLEVVANMPWWATTSREGGDALLRLWRHATAVSLAARRLARESDDPDPDRVARAGFLHGLALWAVASLDPEWLARWTREGDPQRRREAELRDLGMDRETLGRELAERWGCDPLVADAAWLHGDLCAGLEPAAAEPGRLGLIRQAYRLAEKTPWSLACEDGRETLTHDPRVKLLIAEVQSRTGGLFLDGDASGREESLSRANARLRIRLARMASGEASRDRLLSAFAASDPTDAAESWAERASLAWCAEPGVSAARVLWRASAAPTEPVATPSTSPERPPSFEIPLAVKGQVVATIQLWSGSDRAPGLDVPATSLPAWRSWAALVADRERQRSRLADVAASYRRLVASQEASERAAKLDALAEFAAGAGHELNNPLAVVVGRAQLLLLGETDPKVVRSLRAILTQAQRAHRILRDLMYVARPPEPRLRYCQPDEIIRACVRDARPDADDREVRLAAEPLDHGTRVWADPDGLRHLADSLVRNALEATPRGGSVRFTTGGDRSTLRWVVHDSGRGITPGEGGHLFDPFYCGRQAGRGLGMGLPRSARFVAQMGGEIRWHASPGQGSTFQVRIPLTEPPQAPAPEAEKSTAPDSRPGPA